MRWLTEDDFLWQHSGFGASVLFLILHERTILRHMDNDRLALRANPTLWNQRGYFQKMAAFFAIRGSLIDRLPLRFLVMTPHIAIIVLMSVYLYRQPYLSSNHTYRPLSCRSFIRQAYANRNAAGDTDLESVY
ncbi:hypothetical protein L210DRAFT_951275 [Boletus edulis BED1]|uniref:Uncharacterized protein n=1 Tax=Boletus edulis BED1 TaxID=1328754 RepID=A0AAD4G974_BOLED|nr:hypothetical protein L210DRAFT_951275 [Boletus edulis BED1]